MPGRQIRITAFTHPGRVRAGNEDTIVVGDWVSEPEMTEPRQFVNTLTPPLVCAVADGMGGHRAGEVASREAARRLAAMAIRLTDAQAAAAALHDLNAALYRAMAVDARLLGMGTTVVGLALAQRLVWFNVGDSRLYRAGDGPAGGLIQLSIDDTPPGPRTGTITQTLGGLWPQSADRPIAPHVGEEPLGAPARYLLCSDGVTDMLDDAEIAACLAPPDADAVTRLFEAAMRAGGMDNISIVLVSVE
jgi:serine/threonine protein phosphatase PrpC